jgi:Fic-DOC domain mobile mystery protein B
MKFDYPDGATPIDPDEADGLLVAGASTRADLNALEQANIIRARIWALKRKRAEVLSLRFIQRLHAKMFDDVWHWAGTFRKSGKNIGVEWYQIPVELKNLCDDAGYWIQRETYDWYEL